jgi:effector-binding domain-containing protein
MEMKCRLVDREAQATLVIRTRSSVSELPRVLGEAYQRIATYMASIKEEPTGPPYVGYHNDDMQDLDLEIGFPVARAGAGEAEIQTGEIPSGTYASTVYTGPYEEIAEPYNLLMRWIQAQSLQPAGPAYEIYLNDPANTPKQALQTLILLPVIDQN